MINIFVEYESYRFVGKGNPRIKTLSFGMIVGEISTKYKIKNNYNNETVWRLKDNVILN